MDRSSKYTGQKMKQFRRKDHRVNKLQRTLTLYYQSSVHLKCHRGVTESDASVIRPPPEVLDNAYKSLLVLADSEEGDTDSLKNLDLDSDESTPVSGIIRRIFSSSLTTSTIDGLSSGLSWQHLRPNAINLSTHSEG